AATGCTRALVPSNWGSSGGKQSARAVLRSALLAGSIITPMRRSNTSSSTTRTAGLWGGAVGTAVLRSGRSLRVDLKRLEHARIHVVGANQHGQFDDLTIVEMARDLVIDR